MICINSSISKSINHLLPCLKGYPWARVLHSMCRTQILWDHSHSYFPLDPSNFKSLWTNVVSGQGCRMGVGLFLQICVWLPSWALPRAEPEVDLNLRGWRQELISLWSPVADTKENVFASMCLFLLSFIEVTVEFCTRFSLFSVHREVQVLPGREC